MNPPPLPGPVAFTQPDGLLGEAIPLYDLETLRAYGQACRDAAISTERERVLDLLRELDYSPNCRLAIQIREGEIV